MLMTRGQPEKRSRPIGLLQGHMRHGKEGGRTGMRVWDETRRCEAFRQECEDCRG